MQTTVDMNITETPHYEYYIFYVNLSKDVTTRQFLNIKIDFFFSHFLTVHSELREHLGFQIRSRREDDRRLV